MSTEVYWVGKTVIADWVLIDPTTGVFVPDATVTGEVTKPDGTTAVMAAEELADRYRFTYEATVAGLHAYRLEASGAVTSAEEGTFVVRVPLAGADPITTDPTTAIGQVRLLCTDLNEVSPLFTDAQITAMLGLEGDDVRSAAALALETISTSQVLIAKKIRTQDLQTDGPAVAAELRARAKQLREQAAGFDADGEVFGMFVVDYDPDSWLLAGDGS